MKLVGEKIVKVIELTQEELENLITVLDLASFEEEANSKELELIANKLYDDFNEMR